MPLRLHPLYFSHPLPTGRRIHEKMVDLLTPSQREAFYEKVVRERTADPVAAGRGGLRALAAWFFDQWLATYPEVDYSVHKVDSEQQGDGRWRHTITIRREAEHAAIEPVQVLATERGGQRHYLVWNGSTGSGTNIEVSPGTGTIDHVFTLETQHKLRSVMGGPAHAPARGAAGEAAQRRPAVQQPLAAELPLRLHGVRLRGVGVGVPGRKHAGGPACRRCRGECCSR